MKDYVIINGVSSKTKTGLAINILPPITKPEMRTLKEQIDGRDGDIITKLGYSAYDKTIEIGLFGNGYDVDDIIAFFNKEGTIIFSNEPTKFYNFTTLEQFDVERLLEFKTATITFHCQPFKYEVGETPAEIEYQYVTDEGTEITLNNTKNALMQLELNPSELTQETTTGANILPMATYTKNDYGVDINCKNNEITFNGTYTNIPDPSVGRITSLLSNSVTNYANYDNSADYLTLSAGTYTVKLIKISGSKSDSDLPLLSVVKGTTNPKTVVTTVTENLSSTFTLDEESIIRINIRNRGTLTNYKCRATLTKKSSATDELYTGGIPQPNPDYPSEVQVIKGNNSIKIENKNLAPNEWASGFVSRINNSSYAKLETYDSKNCLWYNASAGYGDYDNKYLFTRNWKENTQYTISFEYYGGFYANSQIMYTDGTSTEITTESGTSWHNVTITSDANKTIKYIAPRWRTTDTYINLDTFMVEKSSTASTYVPHQEQVLPLNLPNGMEYCKIGTYEDEFEHDGDKWYLNKYIGKVVLDGSENIIDNSGYATNKFFRVKQRITGAIPGTYCLSNYFIGGNITENTTGLFQINNAGDILLQPSNGIDTADAFKTWLSTHNTDVYFEWSTPTHTEITDTTLISELNAIEQTVSYDEQTNISQTNTGLPFRIKATAMISGSDEVEINNNGNIYAKPILDIKGSGVINVYLDGTQMFSVNITDEIVVDIPNLESYNPNTNALLNRNVTGDIANFIIPTGTHKIAVDGAVNTVTITYYKRWL